MKSILYSFLFYCLFISCAQRVAPLGGKKDIINPKLNLSIPKNQSLNFDGKTIELYFDEYVKVENINQQLIITPTIEGNYVFKAKPTGVRLTFDKPFKPNTTYSFNFRNTFKDITEGNIAKNIRLVFSTGNKIDSLKVSGTVTDPLINKPVLDALVGLYKFTDTLNIKKEKPYYFTKTDSLGKYSIENIQANKYKIYAIIDANSNTVYNELTEKIGYKIDTLNIVKDLQNINLEVVKQDKLPLKIVRTRTSANYANIELNKGIKDFQLKFVDSTKTLPYVLTNEKEIKIINTQSIQDTIKYILTATDSINVNYELPQKFIFKKATKKTEVVKEDLKYTLLPKFAEAIENNPKYIFTFNKPIQNFDRSKLQILNDTLKAIILQDSNYKWNANKNILTISTKTKASKTLRINVLKDTFFSIESDTLKKFNQDNPILIPDDTGTISGEILGAKGNEIVQLINDKNEVIKEIFYEKKYLFKNIIPGKYFLRLIQDLNKNRVWDAGNMDKNIYHEKIQHIISLIQLKANFELTGYNFIVEK
jgi:Bacterial Ig-like domain